MPNPILLGVSACLLGQKVRYDGGHTHDRFLTDTLGEYVEYVPVCPEVECGLGIPREVMRLEGDPTAPRLMTRNSRRDVTPQMREWGAQRLEELAELGLCGYIFKKKSPSSGMSRIKVYGEGGKISTTGVGIWAAMLMQRFPLWAFEDEGRLHDPGIRENFIVRIFAFKRWRDLCEQGRSVKGLIHFHTAHKLLLLAHHEGIYRQMGKLVAQAREVGEEETFARYQELFAKALSYKTTTKKNVNVLQHMQGYFKKLLSADEKQELVELISQYAAGYTPLIVPVTMINHYVRKYGQAYLAEQHYLNPHPIELKLRNHV